MLVYQSKFSTLELKKDKVTDYVLSWKSKGTYNSNFSHCMLLSCIALNFLGLEWEEKTPLTAEQNNHLIKVANVYTVHDLHTWPRNPTINFKSKILVWCN